jgi:cyclopropane fatty-acyl-phospholipid synthase-like methyltransferase
MELTFKDFIKRAKDQKLSKWEKIGFPNSYRENREMFIFEDIRQKLCLDENKVQQILDIGCGCSDLVNHMIEFVIEEDKWLTLVDSKAMLDNISTINSNSQKKIKTIPGCFPNIKTGRNLKYDAILVYSVIQYPFIEQSIFKFIHRCVDLLAPGGRLLIGDVPNISARNRFMDSADGIEFKNQEVPDQDNIGLIHKDDERIDDSVVLSILHRYRNYGCETYLLPQAKKLPFYNRREDILIVRR